MEEKERAVEPNTPQPDPRYKIGIMADGPYLVYGNPPLVQEILVENEENITWEFTPGQTYPTTEDPTPLCRCGHSKKHPYCDGSHAHADWDPTLTADNVPLLEKAELYDGQTVMLADNIKYCSHARICMAKGTVWHLIKTSGKPEDRENAIHESTFCPSGRLKLWDKQAENFIEPPLKPSISLIEDPQMKCSGPLWVKGGIPIDSPDGTKYEQRNRVNLCRCGASANKPFCDGAHVRTRFNDHLPLNTETEGKI